MQLFKRKKSQTTLPPEVQAFATAERRERMGMAWLVGIVSLVVTILVVTGLFYGGRWVYRSLANRNKKATPVVTEPQSDDTKPNATSSTDSDSASQNSTTTDSGQTTPNTSAPNATPSTSSSNTPIQQPVTGDQSVTLPNTGPDVDL